MLMTSAVLAMMLQSSAPAVAANCPYAIVMGGPRDSKVPTYRTPTIAARKVGRLKPGSAVYICAENRNWFWVHYKDGRYSCRGTGNGLDGRAASTCANGWVPKDRIFLVSR
ncbi:MAG: hypothetical protein J0H88_04275 [Sphingomonadales bacterium]|nr:hypothetical protein [Sphingomonadales bacterium]